MTDEDERKIFAQNLKYYVANSGKMQKEIAKDLDVPLQTFNGWCNGVSIPNMGKVQKIADYFKIGKTDLLDEKEDVSIQSLDHLIRTFMKRYSTPKDKSVVDYIVNIACDENIQLLIDIARKSDPSDIKMATDFLRRLQKEYRDD